MISARGEPARDAAYHPDIRGLLKVEATISRMIFANVAIESATRELGERLFTYEVPELLRGEVFIGSLVLVPLGQQTCAAYVVSLETAGQKHQDLGFKVRAILEVLESEPLFDAGYIELLHWVAEYYAASIVDVIAAAIPADIGMRAKRVVRLVQNEHQVDPSGIVNILREAKGHTLSVKALKQRCTLAQGKFYTALAKLRQDGIVSVERESDSKVAPKVVQTVIRGSSEPSTKKQSEIVAALTRGGGQLRVSELAEAASTTAGTIKRMCEQGMLTLVSDEVMRDPLADLAASFQNGTGKAKVPTLTAHQQVAFDTLSTDLAHHFRRGGACDAEPEIPWLLHGVTGSGKTEIYLRLIEQALAAQKTSLMLVPEISLTPQLAHRLVGRFGDQVAVWHSGLSPGERFDTWRRLRAGQAKVLLGARSAILANLPNVGLIILDEEHDSSYKQSSPSPRYHAKTVAIERARRCGAMVLLGSATPDVATFYECRAAGKIVELPERVHKQALPESRMVDMRQEYALGNRSIFSRPLQEAIAQRLKRNEQIILLINRRGYASQVFCRACGYVTRCRHCSVSLVFHQLHNAPKTAPAGPRYGTPWERAGAAPDAHDPDGYLMCHHCGFRSSSWITCPACQSPFVKQLGLGTQRVEEEAQALFPGARLLRLDSDITSRRGAYEEVFEKFVAGEADILIGTQIVAKGLDIARVTLVGVLAADASFNLPDYRSIERGFQLLTQVSGRAGRGEHPGQVILQTFNMDLPALTLARKQDYEAFVSQELESRQAFEYPPFSQILRVVIAGESEAEVQSACEQLAEELSTHLDDTFSEDEVKIVGPAPCLIERIRGRYRHHFIVKNLAKDHGRRIITDFLRTRRGTESLILTVDIDAVDLV